MGFLSRPRLATGWPLRSFSPLASPLPSLLRLRLLPKPTSTRFYSSSRRSTSLITPTFRRPTNLHGLLSQTYIANQDSHGKPTVEEVEEWNKDDLLEWIQQQQPNPLRNDKLEKFKEAKIVGRAFLYAEFIERKYNIPTETLGELVRLVIRIAGKISTKQKRNVQDAFKTGIKYRPPLPLVTTSGLGWKFQPHPELYETLGSTVLSHYKHYKKNEIDKTYIPSYYYIGGPGTGKSRHGTEFASSLQEAIALHPQHPLHHELAQRLKKAFVFHVSFENKTPLTKEEAGDTWNAIGTRMLAQLLDQPLDDVDSQYFARPEAIFRLVAKAENVDLYNDFTGILVVDGLQNYLGKRGDEKDKYLYFHQLLGKIASLSLMSQYFETENGRVKKAPFILTCTTSTCDEPVGACFNSSHRRRVYLPLNRLQPPTWKKDDTPVFNR